MQARAPPRTFGAALNPSGCIHWHHSRCTLNPCRSYPGVASNFSEGLHEQGEGQSQPKRRSLLMSSGAVLLPLISPSTAHAIRKKQEYRDSTTLDAGTSATDFKTHLDQEGIFSCLVPAGWTSVASIDRDAGLLASWYNPFEPGAETLAVYRRVVPDASDTGSLGTAEDLGKALASVAPNSLLLGFDEYTDTKGKVYYTCCVEFDGSTAGRFGSAIELRTVCAAAGVQYTLRITTTRYRYLSFDQVKTELLTVSNSFQLMI